MKLKKLAPACFLLLAFAGKAEPLEAVSAAEAGYDEEKLNELSAVADSLYTDGRIPNYVIALYKDRKRFFSASRGGTRIEGGADQRLPPSIA